MMQHQQLEVTTTLDCDGYTVTSSNIEKDQLEYLLGNHGFVDAVNQDGVLLQLTLDMDNQSLIAKPICENGS